MELTVEEVVSQVLLFLCVAGLSGSVTWTNFKSKFTNGYGLATGVLGQFFLLPFLGYITVEFFNLTLVQGLPILVVTSSPGGVYSNWWCSTCNADLALSIAMTTVSTVVAILMLPVNMLIYVSLTYGDTASSGATQLDWAALIITAVVTGLGVLCGLMVQDRWPESGDMMNIQGNVTGMALIIYAAMTNATSQKPIWDFPADFYYKVGFPLFMAFFIVIIVAVSLDLPKPECSAVVVEVLFQNTTIPIAMALSTFKDKDLQGEALGVVLWYGTLEGLVTGFWLLFCWKIDWTFAPPDVPFWEFLVKNYQPQAGSSNSEPEPREANLPPFVKDGEDGTKSNAKSGDGSNTTGKKGNGRE